MKKLLLITAISLAGTGMPAAQSATPATDGAATATPPAGSTMAPAATTSATAADGTTTTTTVPGADPAAAMSPQDFVDNAASGGLFEVRSSELALERSQTPAVQEFAQMMITDHTAVNEELAALARSRGLTVPGEIMGPPAQHMAAVQAAEGDSFDQTYMQHQVQAHEETIMMFQAAARNGSDPDLRAFAEKTLPALNAHLQQAQGLTTSN